MIVLKTSNNTHTERHINKNEKGTYYPLSFSHSHQSSRKPILKSLTYTLDPLAQEKIDTMKPKTENWTDDTKIKRRYDDDDDDDDMESGKEKLD